MPLDIPALTRGISGLFTAKETGKREAEDRAREQQRQVMADLLSKRRVEEFEQAGRARRQQQGAAAEERKLRASELEAGQRQRLAFILPLLTPENRQAIEGLENQTLADQVKTGETALRRQRTKTDRVPRTVTTPKPFAQDARVRRVVSEFNRLAKAGLNPDDDLVARMRAGNVNAPVPVDTAAVRQQAMLEATNLFKHEFTEEELPELTTILDGIVGEKRDEGVESPDSTFDR
ncbi:hypothetical protein LCGC14_2032040, partial [marine sediment metagenome]